MAVVDSRFRVHGVRGLRVVDASIFPRIPDFFIVTPIYMISEKASKDILEDTRAGAKADTGTTRVTSGTGEIDFSAAQERGRSPVPAQKPRYRADLVLEGGGAKGLVTTGAVIRLFEEGYTFSRIAGISAGAITAAILTATEKAGGDADKLKEVMVDWNRQRFRTLQRRIFHCSVKVFHC